MNCNPKEEQELRSFGIRIRNGHRLYQYCDDLCYQSKNLYNVTNYFVRQVFSGIRKPERQRFPNEREAIETINSCIESLNKVREKTHQRKLSAGKESTLKEWKPLSEENRSLSYELLEGVFKTINQVDYRSIPSHSNQHVIKLVFQDWESFFHSIKDFQVDPSKYKGTPRPPRYAEKDGRKVAFLSNQTCVIKDSKYLKLPNTKQRLNIGKYIAGRGRLKQVRVIPSKNHYTIEVVMAVEKSAPMRSGEPKRMLGIDLGVDNFATIVNNVGEAPLIVKGKVVKSINQYYNKQRAYYYSMLRTGFGTGQGKFTSERLDRLDRKRNDKIKDFLHKASYHVIEEAQRLQVDTIVIGKNSGFKENVELRRKDKQTFIQIPYTSFISMVEYKARHKGIRVIVREESYTSKASFLDNDPIPIYDKENVEQQSFSGRRIKRGLYKSKDGTLINADVNGAANIIKKVVSNAFCEGDRGVVFTPRVLAIR